MYITFTWKLMKCGILMKDSPSSTSTVGSLFFLMWFVGVIDIFWMRISKFPQNWQLNHLISWILHVSRIILQIIPVLPILWKIWKISLNFWNRHCQRHIFVGQKCQKSDHMNAYFRAPLNLFTIFVHNYENLVYYCCFDQYICCFCDELWKKNNNLKILQKLAILHFPALPFFLVDFSGNLPTLKCHIFLWEWVFHLLFFCIVSTISCTLIKHQVLAHLDTLNF